MHDLQAHTGAIVWLAGLLEGEGSFDLHRGRYPRIRLAMTDRDIVDRAAAIMGTTVRLSLHAGRNLPTWHTEIQGPRAAEIMSAILPYMGSRRSERIAAALAAHVYRHADPSRTSIPGPRLSPA